MTNALRPLPVDEFVRLAAHAGLEVSREDLEQLERRRLIQPYDSGSFSRLHLYLLAVYFDAIRCFRHPWAMKQSARSMEDVKATAANVAEVMEALENEVPGDADAAAPLAALAVEVERFLASIDPFGPIADFIDLLRPDVRAGLRGHGRLYCELHITATALADAAERLGAPVGLSGDAPTREVPEELLRETAEITAEDLGFEPEEEPADQTTELAVHDESAPSDLEEETSEPEEEISEPEVMDEGSEPEVMDEISEPKEGQASEPGEEQAFEPEEEQTFEQEEEEASEPEEEQASEPEAEEASEPEEEEASEPEAEETSKPEMEAPSEPEEQASEPELEAPSEPEAEETSEPEEEQASEPKAGETSEPEAEETSEPEAEETSEPEAEETSEPEAEETSASAEISEPEEPGAEQTSEPEDHAADVSEPVRSVPESVDYADFSAEDTELTDVSAAAQEEPSVPNDEAEESEPNDEAEESEPNDETDESEPNDETDESEPNDETDESLRSTVEERAERLETPSEAEEVPPEKPDNPFARDEQTPSGRTQALLDRLEEIKTQRSEPEEVEPDEESNADEESQNLEEKVNELNLMREQMIREQDWSGLVALYEERIDLFDAPADRQQVFLTLATLYEVKLGDDDNAFRCFDAAFEIGVRQGQIKTLNSLRKIGSRDGVHERYTNWLERHLPGASDPDVRGQMQRDLAHAHREAGHPQRAFLSFAAYLAENPDQRIDVDSLDFLDELSIAVDDAELAGFFEDILEHEASDDVKALVGIRAGTFHLGTNEPHHAIRHFRHAFDLDPTSDIAFSNLARLYEREENWGDLRSLIAEKLKSAEGDEAERLRRELGRVVTRETASAEENSP